jgi:hypothetical protein
MCTEKKTTKSKIDHIIDAMDRLSDTLLRHIESQHIANQKPRAVIDTR